MSAARPVVWDLCCCAGGASKGYAEAGFEVVGVDLVDRPNYPYRFVRRDALDVLRDAVRYKHQPRPDLVHMSWPCQRENPLTRGTNASRGWGNSLGLDQPIDEARRLAVALGVPFVLEQPAGHGGVIRNDLVLCTKMLYPAYFPPPWTQRHRCFELHGFAVPQPEHLPWHGHRGYVRGWRHGVRRDGPYVAAYGNGGGKATVAEMQHALEMPWTDVREELTEAIHWRMTEYIGRWFLSEFCCPNGADCERHPRGHNRKALVGEGRLVLSGRTEPP